jgi:hypothetical protein
VDLRKVAAIAASGAVAAGVTVAALGANLGLLESAGAEPVGQLNVTHAPVAVVVPTAPAPAAVAVDPAASIAPPLALPPTAGTATTAPAAPGGVTTEPAAVATTASTLGWADDDDHRGERDEPEPRDGHDDGGENDD